MFVRGKSGNPNGRRAEDRKVKLLARQHTESAVNRLAKLIDSENETAAVAACNAILDRGYGKPKQTIDATVSRRLVDVLQASERREKLLSALARRTAESENRTVQ